MENIIEETPEAPKIIPFEEAFKEKLYELYRDYLLDRTSKGLDNDALLPFIEWCKERV